MAHFVVSQIRLHKSKQKAFVVFCAEAIVPRIGEDGFKLVVKLKPHSATFSNFPEFLKN